jgi:hypothetical protein
MAFTADTILKNLQAVQEARGKKVCFADLGWLPFADELPFRIQTVLSKSAFSKGRWKFPPPLISASASFSP